ncbi:MAG: restriction endonuclease subunit S, partial [Clostridium sp.]|nr:restriction endonuclease subunit S [Clostridium sp.]
QIRFQGFTEEWEQRKLGEIAVYGNGSGHEEHVLSQGKYELITLKSINSEGKLISSGKYLDIETETLKKGVIIMMLSEQAQGMLGMTTVIPCDNKYVLNQRIASLTPIEDYESSFLTKAINNKQTYFEQMGAGTKVQNITKGNVENCTLNIPKIDEQKKIGDFFDSLDNLITLHQRKSDSLVKVKKSMLEKMFPRRGAKKPEIRFARFTDDWEQRKLKDIVIIERGGSPRPIESFITNSENGLNWVKIGDAHEQGNYITKTKEKIKPEGLTKTREVHPGDLILSNSMSFGKPYIMGIDGCIHDGWLLIRDVNKIFDLKYLCCMLGTEQMLSQYKSMAAGSTVNNLNKELVGNTIIKYPNKNEQKQIGAFFDKIDNLITLHQRKLNLLKNMKKAMLEKMFV